MTIDRMKLPSVRILLAFILFFTLTSMQWVNGQSQDPASSLRFALDAREIETMPWTPEVAESFKAHVGRGARHYEVAEKKLCRFEIHVHFADGLPARNKTVLLTRGRYRSDESSMQAVTDKIGLVVFENIEAGSWTGTCFPHIGSMRVQVVEDGAVFWTINRGPTVEGTVLDNDAKPIPNAEIHFEYKRTGRRVVIGRSDARGKFSFSSVMCAGKIFATGPGFSPSDSKTIAGTHEAGSSKHILVVGNSGGSFLGVVEDDRGQRISGLRVELFKGHRRHPGSRVFEAEFITDDDGSFRMTGIARGQYFVKVQKRGFASIEQLINVGTETQFKVTLQPGGKVAGVIRDKAGIVLPHQTINMSLKSKRGIRFTAKSDVLGQFVFDDLAAGEYTLHTFSSMGTINRDVTVSVGKETSCSLELDLGESICGRLMGQNGQPLGSWRVRVIAGVNSDHQWRNNAVHTQSNDLGYFRMRGLKPGEYQVQISDRDGQLREVYGHVKPNKDVMVMVIGRDRLASVSGTFDCADDVVRKVAIKLVGRTTVRMTVDEATGSFSSSGIFPGEYDLTIEHSKKWGRKSPTKRIVVQPGSKMDLGKIDGSYFGEKSDSSKD